jgi:hypothetical protein
MASAFDPATSLLAWKGFADGAKINQPGAVTPHHAENKYKVYAAKAIGEMAYGGFNHYLGNRAANKEKAKKKKLLKETNMIYGDSFEALRSMGDDPYSDNSQFDTSDSTVFGKTVVPSITEEKSNTKGFDTTSLPKGEPFKETKKGILGTNTWVPEAKPLTMKAPTWRKELAKRPPEERERGNWTWKADQYSGKADDYNIGDRVKVRNMLYQVVEGRNGMKQIIPIY